eukprot:2789207-Prymnesium_polylepis.1
MRARRGGASKKLFTWLPTHAWNTLRVVALRRHREGNVSPRSATRVGTRLGLLRLCFGDLLRTRVNGDASCAVEMRGILRRSRRPRKTILVTRSTIFDAGRRLNTLEWLECLGC